MASHGWGISGFFTLLKSWLPRRSESASRDYWMPDHSCMVCYECDMSFTLLNRRHHCRSCGRIFCGKCTTNSIPDDPTNGGEEGDMVRVCNYCFKQWEKKMAAAAAQSAAAVKYGSGLRLSPSLSTQSIESTKSSSTVNSSSVTGGSRTYSNGHYPRMSYGSSRSLGQPVGDALEKLGSERNSILEDGETSPNQFGFCMNRSDDDEDEYVGCNSHSETPRFQQSDCYYSQVEFEESDRNYQPKNVLLAEEYTNTGDVCSPLDEDAEFCVSLDAKRMMEDTGTDNSCEGDATSSMYGMETSDAKPVDFENNGLLWLPPEPEDEEDEREPGLFDDEDDEDITGEWGYLRSSNSFGSGEYRSIDRSGEEHKKVMKNVVDGRLRALIAQHLQVENLPMGEEDDTESWLEIITSLSWEAATLLKPDTSKGGGMDPGGYVNVKCLACGHRSQSMVVQGIVCKQNVAHRRMSSRIEKPRFLMLGGALEYQRVTYLLSSFDTFPQQEMDHLKMAVAKIDAYNPNVLLVEKSVSWFAQEYLLAKDISLVSNIKRPLLERIARCSGSHIVPSIDHLSSQKLGICDLFHVEKFHEEHGSAGQGGKKLTKTLMFFEGCPNPLGCTILLKGANGDELKKVKHVVLYGVFAAYHLAVETSFLADEGASLPELPLKSPLTVSLPDRPSINDRYISKVPDFSVPASIVVSRSIRCVWKGVVCERSHLVRLKYYGNLSLDEPLGKFLRDHLFDMTYSCRFCDMPSEAHVHSYTHRQGSLTISVRKLPELLLPGEREGKIWMWHRCLRCPRNFGLPPATRRIVMSDAAWGLSFGKFLELSFSNHAAASRVASCGHSLHRDCLRFYGLGKMVACFRYASIDLHSVYLPPSKLDQHHQERIEKESNEVVEWAKQLFWGTLRKMCGGSA